ncbi:hypothetical protein GE061_007417 [Apolygus lucorum]|uniref:Uncharacterized protein n=1 Tax=Apolygus lucorum TaxID=248454 RepID=A0A8S9WTD7_APOLU|nr:hypothetical protein GE061_007417 [Apolygus lucorum]
MQEDGSTTRKREAESCMDYDAGSAGANKEQQDEVVGKTIHVKNKDISGVIAAKLQPQGPTLSRLKTKSKLQHLFPSERSLRNGQLLPNLHLLETYSYRRRGDLKELSGLHNVLTCEGGCGIIICFPGVVFGGRC